MYKPSLTIATPTYTGTVRYEHYLSALQTQTILADSGVQARVIVVAECPWVGHARADAVAQFLAATKHSDDRLLFIDADVSWHAEDVLRMMRHNVEFVGAVQCDKHTGRMLIGAKGKQPGDTHRFKFDPYTELLGPIQRIATCFMMLKRSVFEKMIKAYPEAHVENARFARQRGLAEWFYGFFGQPVIPHVYGDSASWPGEDTHFCDLWVQTGGEIFVDPYVQLTHTVFHPMTGRLADQEGFPPRKLAGAALPVPAEAAA